MIIFKFDNWSKVESSGTIKRNVQVGTIECTHYFLRLKGDEVAVGEVPGLKGSFQESSLKNFSRGKKFFSFF